MSEAILKNTKIAIEKEVAEGSLVLPAGAGSFIGVLEDGINDAVKPAKEVLERAQLSATMDKGASRSGIKSVNGTIGCELKAGEANAAPEYGVMVESALGGTKVAVAEITSGTTHTTSVINLTPTTGIAAGDIVLVKTAGAYHVSPVKTVVTDTSIELLVPAATAFADNVKVEKLLDYRAASSGHPTYSVTEYIENAVRRTAAGCKTTNMSIENWSTGQQPTIKFTFEGLSYTVTLNAPDYTPDIDESLPLVALKACLYKDGVAIGVNDVSVALENTLGYKTTTCSENGRIGSRVTSRKLSGTFNPYLQSDSIANFTAWDTDTVFSLFAWASNPGTVAGEGKEIVAFYIPACQITELAQADQDGLLQENISFEARAHATLPLMIMAYK